MIKRIALLTLLVAPLWLSAQVRTEKLLEKGWKFTREDNPEFKTSQFDDTKWAIGLYPTRLGYLWSFQYQQRQTEHGDCSRRTERSDGTRRAYRRFTLRRNRLVQASIRCPRIYRREKCTLVFDGAMSHARVYINGKEAGYWA